MPRTVFIDQERKLEREPVKRPPNVDVIQHVKKCLKLQREAKNMDTLWKFKGFFCEDRREEGKMKGKRRRDGETTREEKEERR